MASYKEQEWDLIKRINLAYQGSEPTIQALVDLLQMRRHQRLELLVKAPPSVIQPLQGECNALQELIEDIIVQRKAGKV